MNLFQFTYYNCIQFFRNFLIISWRFRCRDKKKIRKQQGVIADMSCGIIMVMQIECQRNVIHHDFLDSHGGWHLKIPPLIIAPAACYCENKESTTSCEGEPYFDPRDRKTKWTRQPLGTRDISSHNREPVGYWLFDPNVKYRQSFYFNMFPCLFHFKRSIGTLVYLIVTLQIKAG